MTGTIPIVAFTMLALKGVIKRFDDDDADKAAYEGAEGTRGTYINFSALLRAMSGGDTQWYKDDVFTNLGRIEPFNAQMTMGVELSNAMKEDGVLSAEDIAKSNMKAIEAAVTGLSCIQTLNDIYSGLKYKDENESALSVIGKSLVSSNVTSLTPGIVQQAAKAGDKYYRDLYSSDTFGGLVLDAWKSTIPGLRETVPTKLTNFGESKQYEQSAGLRFTNALLNPYTTGKYLPQSTTAEFERLYAVTGKTSIYPNRKAPNSISDKTSDYELTGAEQRTYQETYGKYAKTQLDSLFKSAEYKAMSDEEKVKAVSDIYSAATVEAKRKIIEGRGEMYLPDSTAVKLVDSFAGAGLSKDKAYSLYKTLDALTPEQGKSSVSNQQKAKTVVQQGYSKTQTVALVGTLWDKTGADECKTLLPSLNVAQRLVTMYVDSGNSDLVNMTTPRTFSENSVTYELTDAEMTQFSKVYADYFNQRATNLMSEDTLVRIKKEAYNRAKYSVINGRK